MVCLGAAACSGQGGADGGSDAQLQSGGEGAAVRYEYGDDANQFGDLTLPFDGDRAVPVVVLIHGGFWRTGFGLDLMEPLVPSLVGAGYAVWNVEYRRVGRGPDGGGGYTATFDDLAAAIDLLAALPAETRNRLDLDRVATVGHSAGGHLAGWLASRTSLPSGAAWSAPGVAPVIVVSQAGVLDLERCIADGVGGTACRDLLLGGDESNGLTDRIALTSPAALVPISARVVAVHGTGDTIVPLDQSTGYVADAQATGMDAELMAIDGADHFDMINPAHPAWSTVLNVLVDQFGSV